MALINGGKTLVIANDDDFGVSNGATAGIAAKINPVTTTIDYDSLFFVGLASATVPLSISAAPEARTISTI